VSESVFDDLFAEAERQLRICDACRFCEGYCAVFPALERVDVLVGLTRGDVEHLANLCHDCRDCFYACMYAPPHEFAVNPPAVFTEIRQATYATHAWRPPLPGRLRGSGARAVGLVVAVAAVVVFTVLSEGIGALWRSRETPYRLVAYPALLALTALPAVWGAGVMLAGAARYWRETNGRLRTLMNPRALGRAGVAAVRLRYLRGGGAECSYPDEAPSPIRRRLHTAVFLGFAACFAATVAAAVEQDLLGLSPPYPVLSVPVLLGVAGGAAMLVGCTGLAVLKGRVDPAPASAESTTMDYALLVALDALAGTGLLTLLLRTTALFGPVLTVHLATVVACFAVAPYTKFVHAVYRFLALVCDAAETNS
jgi:citrate/tricarballylate utilization protein